jgi:hypothetical protein
MRIFIPCLTVLFLAAGCGPTITVKHEVDAHVTMDINLRVDRRLDSFFGDIEASAAEEETTESAPADGEGESE